MKHAFIVRPFGKKEGVDFDDVDKRLIQEALKSAKLEGFTTAKVIEAGNIREDMFGFLATADLVIADISIHNANVFYELGIRHALRPRGTVMIRTQIKKLAHPFDLQTDRYFAYDLDKLKSRVEALAATIRATAASDRVDSPVYHLLPELKAPDPATLKVVPRGFGEEVSRARAEQNHGDLRLRAHEARWFDWASEGLRAVGRAQFIIKAFHGAKETYEALLEIVPDDIDANLRLATVYNKLGAHAESDVALDRVIGRTTDRSQLAEALALRARNMKTLWQRAIKDVAPDTIRAAALKAPELRKAEQAYKDGFDQDLNAFYPGINALSLLCVRLELAKLEPKVWVDLHDSDADAERMLASERKRFDELAASVRLCLAANRAALERMPKPDDDALLWLGITEADHAFLTGDRPARVAQRYHEALSNAPAFAVESARAQLEIFEKLGVRAEFAHETLALLRQPALGGGGRPQLKHVLLFTGHVVDAADREKKGKARRFPNTPEAEAEAKRLIREAVEAEAAQHPEGVVGLAGGACGGDILFHEVCADLKIETSLYLALPRDKFAAESVVHGGTGWMTRYKRLVASHDPPAVLSESMDLPGWLASKEKYSIWERNNLWMLFHALVKNPSSLTLIALWNGEEGDGPGGTGDLVEQANSRGQTTIILDAKPLAGLGPPKPASPARKRPRTRK